MNERIVWDLVSKAREHAVSDTPDGGKCFDQDVFHNKFAELIVEECGVALNPPVQVRNVLSRGQAYNLIKQHFGVKE